MQIREVMNPSIASIMSQATLLQAAEQFRKQQTEALLVLEGEMPRGVVTKQEVVGEVLRDDGGRASARRVREIMNPKMAACYHDADIDEVRRFAKQKDIRRLLVCNRNKEVIGIACSEVLKTDK